MSRVRISSPAPKMSSNVKILQLFPSPVYVTSIDRPLNTEELDFFKSQRTHVSSNIGNENSKNQRVLDSDALKDLKEFCDSHIKQYMDNVLCCTDDTELYITQSWLNWTAPNGFHHKHSHVNSFVSGVFYIKSNMLNDRIKFHDMRYRQLSPNTKEFNQFNSSTWEVPVQTGTLLLFPSELVHSVDSDSTKNNKSIRTSLAFNTFVRGKLGHEQDSTSLTLS